MPIARNVLNAFTAVEVSRITGLSAPMIDYLLREKLLSPSYAGKASRRGKVRYYSYRDLVVARLIQTLRDSGIQLKRLKGAVRALCKSRSWTSEDPTVRLTWLISDGKEVFLRNQDGFLDAMTGGGQRAFAFVVNLPQLEAEVREAVPPAKLAHFDLQNRSLIYEDELEQVAAQSRRQAVRHV
ncbi:MAG TPA: MerR family transcriptional regulator [Bradyrhizobium sp.]|nr:MerR family transcriptional regulator [Bradyrhizobium sp.]